MRRRRRASPGGRLTTERQRRGCPAIRRLRPSTKTAPARKEGAHARLTRFRFLLLFGGDLLADLLERPADQARDVHLRDPDLLRDLRLREPLEEAQVQDLPLPVVEDAETGREHGPILRDLVLVLLRPDRLERVELAVLVGAAAGRERQRAVRAPALERLEHLLLLDAGGLRELADRGRAAELDRQLLDQARELDVQLLEAARHAYRPALVAEVPLDLADDVGRRVRRQLDAAVEIEAVDRLDQADRADLDEILELLAAVRVAARERADERHVLLDQLLPRGEVALLVVAAEEGLVVLLGGHQRAPSGATTCFVSVTQSPPSPSWRSTRSTTVSRTRRRPTASLSRSSSRRTVPPGNGPTLASIASARTETVTVTS